MHNADLTVPGISPGAYLRHPKDDPYFRRYACENPLHMNGNPEIWCNRTSATWSQRPPYCRSKLHFLVLVQTSISHACLHLADFSCSANSLSLSLSPSLSLLSLSLSVADCEILILTHI